MRIAVMLGVLVVLVCLFGFSPGEDGCECGCDSCDGCSMTISITDGEFKVHAAGYNFVKYKVNYTHSHEGYTYKVHHTCTHYNSSDRVINNPVYTWKENPGWDGEMENIVTWACAYVIVTAKIKCTCGNEKSATALRIDGGPGEEE